MAELKCPHCGQMWLGSDTNGGTAFLLPEPRPSENRPHTALISAENEEAKHDAKKRNRPDRGGSVLHIIIYSLLRISVF